MWKTFSIASGILEVLNIFFGDLLKYLLERQSDNGRGTHTCTHIGRDGEEKTSTHLFALQIVTPAKTGSDSS